jgi:ketosteroid isomerase-like protein
MSEQDNLKVVKDTYRAYRERNFDILRECLATDVKWSAIGPPYLIPTAGTRFGPDQVEQYFITLEDVEGVQSLEPIEFIVADDKVVVIGELERRSHLTGNLNQSPWVHIFTLRNERISDFRAFYDTGEAVTALMGFAQPQSLRKAS